MVLQLYQILLAHVQTPISLLLAEHSGPYMLDIYCFLSSN